MHTRHSKFVGLLLGAAPSFLNLEPAKEREVKSSQAPGLDSGNFKTFCLGPNHQPGDGEVPKVDGAHKEHTQRDTPYVHMTRCLEPVAQQWIKESRNSDFGDIQHADAQEPSQEGLHRPAERARRGSPGEVDSDGVEDSNLRDRGREGHQQAGSQQDRAADLDQEAQHGFEEEGRPTGLLQDRIGNESHFQRDHAIPQLQKAAMERIYQKSEAHETDPVGFGNYSSLSYQEIAEMQGEYAQWVVATAREGQCCNRLMRLANWLEKNTEIKKKDGMNKNPPYSKANPKTVTPVAKAPSEAASCTGSTAALMGAMGQIMEQMKSMQSEMEELRGRHRKKPKEENSEMESWDAVSTPPQKSP